MKMAIGITTPNAGYHTYFSVNLRWIGINSVISDSGNKNIQTHTLTLHKLVQPPVLRTRL